VPVVSNGRTTEVPSSSSAACASVMILAFPVRGAGRRSLPGLAADAADSLKSLRLWALVSR
jgi:hypothetical protein